MRKTAAVLTQAFIKRAEQAGLTTTSLPNWSEKTLAGVKADLSGKRTVDTRSLSDVRNQDAAQLRGQRTIGSLPAEAMLRPGDAAYAERQREVDAYKRGNPEIVKALGTLR